MNLKEIVKIALKDFNINNPIAYKEND